MSSINSLTGILFETFSIYERGKIERNRDREVEKADKKKLFKQRKIVYKHLG
jgi:hypothetical protein